MTDTSFEKASAAAGFVTRRTELRPRLAIVLGSGLGAFAEQLEEKTAIPFAEIPHFPQSTVPGHSGKLVIGKVAGVPVAVMQGRVHAYEGYSSEEVVFPIRVLGGLGVTQLVLTNAAGGINLNYQQGALVLIRDHINLQGANPLTGRNDDRFGVRFPDMTHAYARAYRELAREGAGKLGMILHEGVYAGLLGPSYETPAEIIYLRTIGADLVGMSTVFEVIAARHMGIKVLAISCVTNMAAGILDQALSHQEVMETGERVKTSFEALLSAVLPRIEKDVAT